MEMQPSFIIDRALSDQRAWELISGDEGIETHPSFIVDQVLRNQRAWGACR